MQQEAWFFIGVFVFIFIIWVATGGPTHPISFAGPFLSPPSPLGSGTYIGLPRAPFSVGNSEVHLANPDTGTGASYDPGTGTTGSSLSGVAFGAPSGYRGQVTLGHYVSGAGGPAGKEYLTLSLSRSASTPLTLSGWTIESEASGNAVVIPAGTEVPMSGTIEALQLIVLRPGDSALLISGRSPIGASFRENKCIGYFGQYQTFSPPLPNTCPTPNNELIQFYGPNYIRDQACIDYVAKLNRCTLAISPPVGLSSQCQSFLENHLSYNGCVQGHQNDPDFKNGLWRIYLGRSTAMWRTTHEVVKLLDADGKTVDAFTY